MNGFFAQLKLRNRLRTSAKRSDGAILEAMNAVKARVRNGRLVLDEPTDLPEGTEVTLAPIETGEELDDEERAELDEAIREGIAEKRAGKKGVDGSALIARLRARA